jgi:hypothetical protein
MLWGISPLFTSEIKMLFDLAQAILWPYYRTGRHFELSQPVLDRVNAIIDQEEKQRAQLAHTACTATTEGGPEMPGAS